ncbi:hypothetical protein J6590_071925 [Homalodisca vitripennis]|nr:hypothetical protein J6590_087608 [Homalodisca vitripennis]KAG8325270.1 hypothetical protein J6590_071925 [Homalodisca vitripennis]
MDVSCRCRYQCRSLTFDQKLNIFNQFYELGDNIKQNSYLMGNLSVCGVKRRRHGSYDDPTLSRRQATVFFTIPDGNGNHIQVCNQTFKEIHAITRRRVETLVKAKKTGDVTYVERRGNTTKERKYNSDDVKRIVAHIDSFPKEESHYTRAKSTLL